MSPACCPSCRLRFTPEATARFTVCPECSAPLEADVALRDSVGYRLHGMTNPPGESPLAVEVSLPGPDWLGHD